MLLRTSIRRFSESNYRIITHYKHTFKHCGAEDDLNEPFVRLLMLVRAVNEENILVKESGEEIEF